MSRRDPMIDVKMVASRQFGACFAVMLQPGRSLRDDLVLPLLVQSEFGYTAFWAGLVLSPGGLVTMTMMVIVGRVSGRVQPKYLIMAGAAFTAFSMHDLTNVYGDLGFWFFATSRMTLGVGLPLIFIPIITASYDGIRRQDRPGLGADQRVANTGGSMGVSLASNVLTDREQFHQARLVGDVIPSSPQYQNTLHQATQYFQAQGSSLAQAQHQAFAWIGQQVQTQAAYLAYIDVFWVLMLLALAAIPLALSLRKVKLGAPLPRGIDRDARDNDSVRAHAPAASTRSGANDARRS